MASKMDELDTLLQSLQTLKAPGASKGKITAITTLCLENVQSESIIAQKLYRHFKKTLPTHKLGVLFVVDSVIRQWIEKARQSGQELSGSAAPDGTYASGIHKITEMMPALVDDLLKVAPQDQKAKVQNLVDIWKRGNTFPAKDLAEFEQKLKDPPPFVASSTPPGSPPKALIASLGLAGPKTNSIAGSQVFAPAPAPAPPATTQDASSILAALAGLTKPAPQAVGPSLLPPAAPPAAPPTQDLSALLGSLAQPQQQTSQALTLPPFNMSSTHPGYPPAYPQPDRTLSQPAIPPPISGFGAVPPPPVQHALQQPAASQQDLVMAIARALPPHIVSNPASLAQAVELFQGLANAGVPQDQWGPVLAALMPAGGQPAAPPSSQDFYQQTGADQQYGGYQEPDRFSRDPRDPRGRGRSRSPDYRRDRDRGGATNRRPSPVYGAYDPSAAQQTAPPEADSNDRRGRGRGGRFRQRSPLRGARLDSPGMTGPVKPKWTEIDPTLPPGHIKVLSRTLFVGGANGSEQDLRAIFSRFGDVQTCIVNNDKRHAFVKMYNRQDAVNAKTGMEHMTDSDVLHKARQTKWGVGFGPRECCDYSTGVSVIPIDHLTEADVKWMLTAPTGGTGGRNIESGLVVEEPDIEIGAGVSSKAMSRRIDPDKGGKRGRGGRYGGGGGGRLQDRYDGPRNESPQPVGVPPAVPNFGFNFNMPGGMPPFQ